MNDRYLDLLKQGFMKHGRKPRKATKQAPPIVSCAKCQDWHRKGKHTRPPS